MSLTKRLLEEREERGWESLDKAICPGCLSDPALKALAEETLDADQCAYCQRTGEAVACDTDLILERIGEGFRFEFTHPAEVLFYETREGGYQGDVFETHDLIWKLDREIGDDAFVEDVVRAFGSTPWTDREPYVTPRDESLLFSWDRFADLVKYESRYLFLSRSGDEYPEPHDVGPGEMLAVIGELVAEADLVGELATGTDIYRARPDSPGAFVPNARELGTAPREKAFSNRMSPAGIPLFYGAFDAETAARESWTGPVAGKEQVTIGRFTNSERLKVLDLAALQDVPSLFDELRHLRPALKFLRAFSERVSAPVRSVPRSESEAVAYVPTQVVAEFFRNLYAGGGASIDGIVYRSAASVGGVCCALFVDRERCLDHGASVGDEAALVLEDFVVWAALP